MNSKFKVIAYIVIALMTLAAIGWGYFCKPIRAFMPALTAMADSSKKDEKARYRVNSFKKYPPKKQFLNVDLNSVDTATLVKGRGIGKVFAQRIIEYRNRLGGYVSLEQLKEVRGVNNEIFATISQNFWVDTAVIQKININFASQNTLERHPYFTSSMARRLIEARKLKGGFNNHQQLINNDILTPREARKVAPYLMF